MKYIDPEVIRSAALNGADLYPYAEYRPIPEATTQPVIVPWLFMLHTMANPGSVTPGQLWNYINRGDVTGEPHLILGYDTFIQALPFTVRADNNAKANSWYVGNQRVGAVSVETQDNGSNVDPGIAHTPWNDYQVEHLVGVSLFLHLRYGVPFARCPKWDSRGIDGHRAHPEWSIYVGKTCPGQTRWEQIPAIISAAAALASPPSQGVDVTVEAFIVKSPAKRVFDSRDGAGAWTPGLTRDVNVQTTKKAVFVNLTVVDPTAAGYLTAWGEGSRPNVSNLNYAPGQTISNSAWVPVVNGKVKIFSKAAANIIVDVQATSTT